MTTELPAAARAAGFATIPEHATRQAARLCRLARHRGHVLLGPVVWDPDRPGWSYFTIGIPERDRWRFERIDGEDQTELEAFRAALVRALIEHRPIVIHDLDDELRMARLCDAILPTEHTAALCREIAAERVHLAAFRHEAAEQVQ